MSVLGEAESRELRDAVGAALVPVSALALRREGARVVHVRVPVSQLLSAAAACTLGGAAAVVVTPRGEPMPLPWWGLRFQRFVVGSQEEAHAWRRVGLPLGRLVVVEDGPVDWQAAALGAVYAEVASMGRRPDWADILRVRGR